MSHPIVSREEWLEARKALLEKERALTHQRDAVSAERRALREGKLLADGARIRVRGRGAPGAAATAPRP